jgi:hypothetical protein
MTGNCVQVGPKVQTRAAYPVPSLCIENKVATCGQFERHAPMRYLSRDVDGKNGKK